MKRLFKHLILFAILIGGSSAVFAQNNDEECNSHFEKREAILTQVSDYLKKNSNYVLSSEEQTVFKSTLKADKEHDEVFDERKMKEKFIKSLLTQRFFVENPMLKSGLNKNLPFSWPSPCYKGDFESSSLATFEGYWHVGTTSTQCDQIPLDVDAAPSYVAIPMTGLEPQFELMNTGTDPLVPGGALQLTSGGSLHSLRINPNDGGGQDISVLQKNFSTPITGDQIVSFNSAIVLEFPHNNSYDPFLTARILNAAGTVVGGPICITPTSVGIDWNPFSISWKDYVWMDWKCFNIPYYGIMGDNYTLEISVGDCAYSVHGGYAYVDDICNVVCSPINTGCCEASAGQVLSWSEVPGAVSYEVDFYFNDPNCCSVGGTPVGLSVPTTENVIMPPSGYSDCFSWRVRAVFSDGSKSGYSERQCDCIVEDEPVGCEVPSNMDCKNINGQRYLSWDAVVGALGGYQVMITYNDPTCPGCSGPVSTVSISTMDPWIEVADGTTCFSWKVRSICNAATVSDWSPDMCSCPISTPFMQGELKNANSESELKLLVVPNPASDFVSITFNGGDRIEEGDVQFILFSSAGNKIYESQISEDKTLKINVSKFESGMYVYSLVQGGAIIESGKLILD